VTFHLLLCLQWREICAVCCAVFLCFELFHWLPMRNSMFQASFKRFPYFCVVLLQFEEIISYFRPMLARHSISSLTHLAQHRNKGQNHLPPEQMDHPTVRYLFAPKLVSDLLMLPQPSVFASFTSALCLVISCLSCCAAKLPRSQILIRTE